MRHRKRTYNRYDQYWKNLNAPRAFRRAVAISVCLHAGCILAMYAASSLHTPKVITPVFQVQLVQDMQTPGEPAETEEVQPDPEPEPPPEPPPPPEPAPPPPPEPKKEEPKPKEPEPKPVEKPKPEEPKKEEKKKEEPKKEEKKKEEPKKEEKKAPAKTETPVKAEKTGVTLQQQLPTALGLWGSMVQRKVERVWQVPGGIPFTEEGNAAIVSFWVNREGQLISEPQVIQQASDPSLAASGVLSIKQAAPFPPLPPDFRGSEQQVVYVFTVVR